jgi:flagellar basal-body rod protein FlgB
MTINTERMQFLAKLLDVAAVRQEVIAQNIANVNTPGYSTLGVSFEDALNGAAAAGTPPTAVAPEIAPTSGGLTRADGNNVDIDLEISRLQKNAIYFQVYTQMLANDLAQFRSAIRGN